MLPPGQVQYNPGFELVHPAKSVSRDGRQSHLNLSVKQKNEVEFRLALCPLVVLL